MTFIHGLDNVLMKIIEIPDKDNRDSFLNWKSMGQLTTNHNLGRDTILL